MEKICTAKFENGESVRTVKESAKNFEILVYENGIFHEVKIVGGRMKIDDRTVNGEVEIWAD